MQVCNYYLLRHAKVVGEPALNGHSDCLVDPAIQAQLCSALGNQNIPFTHLISSPLRRCADLAVLLNQAQPEVKQTYNAQLREMSFGELDGRPFTRIKPHWPLLDAFWQDPANNTLPQAETLQQFQQRITTAWRDLISSNNDNTLVITHGGVIRMILAEALQVEWKNPAWHANLAIANGSLTHIQVSKAERDYISVKSIGSELLPEHRG